MVSPGEMHNYLRTVTVAPMITGSHVAPFRVSVSQAGKKGWILLDQIRGGGQGPVGKETGRSVGDDSQFRLKHAARSI
jgi:mRNA interferase MazF